MKKSTKRILSMILAVCLILTGVVPSVLATEAAQTIMFGTGDSSSIEIYLNGGSASTSGYTPYAANTEHTFTGWTYLNQSDPANSILVNKASKKYITALFDSSDQADGDWFAIRINVAAASTYDMTFGMGYGTKGGFTKVYVMDCDVYAAAIQGYPLGTTAESALTKEQNDAIYAALEGKTLAEGVLDSNKDGTNDQSIGCVEFAEAGNYVLLFSCYGKGASGYRFIPSSISLTPVVATVKGVGYMTLAAAIAAAKTGDEIDLQADVTTDTAIELKDGVTLDLNGKTLNANVNDTAGQIIDSTGGSGRVEGATLNNIAADQLVLKDKDNYLHICDYTLSKPEDYAEKSQDGNTVTFWFDVRFENSAVYKLIAESDDAFSVSATFAWNGVEAGTAQFATGMSVKGWAELMQESENFSFYVKVTGLNAATASGELSVLPTITGGATLSGMTYNVTAAQ